MMMVGSNSDNNGDEDDCGSDNKQMTTGDFPCICSHVGPESQYIWAR